MGLESRLACYFLLLMSHVLSFLRFLSPHLQNSKKEICCTHSTFDPFPLVRVQHVLVSWQKIIAVRDCLQSDLQVPPFLVPETGRKDSRSDPPFEFDDDIFLLFSSECQTGRILGAFIEVITVLLMFIRSGALLQYEYIKLLSPVVLVSSVVETVAVSGPMSAR